MDREIFYREEKIVKSFRAFASFRLAAKCLLNPLRGQLGLSG